MTIHARQGLPSWWALTFVAMLPLAPGCSRDPETKDELVQVVDSRGIITYRYVNAMPAAQSPEATTSPDLLSELRQFDAENRQRQRDAVAAQDMRRAFDDQLRREQKEQQAYQDALRRDQDDQRKQKREQMLEDREQQRQSAEIQRQRIQQEPLQWQQASQALDARLQQLRQQQEQQDSMHGR